MTDILGMFKQIVLDHEKLRQWDAEAAADWKTWSAELEKRADLERDVKLAAADHAAERGKDWGSEWLEDNLRDERDSLAASRDRGEA